MEKVLREGTYKPNITQIEAFAVKLACGTHARNALV